MVASRYHNLLAAVIAGIPVISLSYGPKNGALLEDLGAPPWDHEIDEFDVEDVIAQMREALSRKTPGVGLALPMCRQALREEFDRLTHA
jgi:polysaccharide pyruvyl transferase WcaK-like protein